MSLFDLPTKDTPLGPKNAGVAAFDKMIVQPVSQPGGVRALTPGEAVTFRWRSDSSKWTNYKECRLYCRWEIRVGPVAGAANGAALTRGALPPNLRFSACPNTAAFGGGCKYTLNGTVINNCPGTYYEHAMANLWQKQDGSGETAGSNALLTRDKRMRAAMETAHQSEDGNMTHDNQRLPSKQAMVRLGTPYAAADFGNFEVEIEDLIHISAFQTGQLAPPGDHELEFVVAQHAGEDMFYSQTMVAGINAAGNALNYPAYTRVNIVGSNGFPAALNNGEVYACLRHCELHVAYASPQMPVIPSSVQQRLSSMQVLTRAIDSSNVNVQLVIPPSTRQVWVGMRQNAHDIRMDREEMGNASVEIDELGLIQPAPLAGAPATRPFGWTNFQLRCGTASAPNIPYANLDARSGKYSRVFNDALSVCGKPNGLRGTEWSFDEFCGQTSANGVVYGAAAAGVAADLADKVLGDMGGLIMARLITPPGSRDNTLFIDGTLRGYNAGAQQELVVICIYEELVQMEYAPPQELPISTTRVHVI